MDDHKKSKDEIEAYIGAYKNLYKEQAKPKADQDKTEIEDMTKEVAKKAADLPKGFDAKLVQTAVADYYALEKLMKEHIPTDQQENFGKFL